MGGDMFGGGGGWSQAVKDDTYVDFPLEGLDISQYIVSEPKIMSPNGEPMIYDCYAVSNHFGGTGGGHYTAFAKSPVDHKWYSFDDSSVTEVNESSLKHTVVTTAAYNVFYRRRDWHAANKAEETIDFQRLAQTPDMSYIQSEEKKEETEKKEEGETKNEGAVDIEAKNESEQQKDKIESKED